MNDQQWSHLFPGTGEMARLCRVVDWEHTPLGPVKAWAPELRLSVASMLRVQFPTLLLWGPEHVQLYNDGYRALMGPRHPHGLGQRNIDCWPEFWAVNKPLFDRVLAGETVTLENAPYALDRDGSGVLQECFFTMSWSAVAGAAGHPSGVLAICVETTADVMGRRYRGEREHTLRAEQAARELAEAAGHRAERLRDVVGALSGAPDAAAVYEVLVTEARLAFGAHAGAVALLDEQAQAQALRFVRWFGYADDVMGDWLRVPLAASFPLTDAVRAGAPLWIPTRDAMLERWPGFAEGSQAIPSEAWAVLPLIAGDRTLGALALSFPEPRPIDPDILAFSDALVGHCAQALERARLYDAERAAHAEAEFASQAKSRFLSVLSHELRNPLHSIGCFAEVLASGAQGPLAPAQEETLRKLLRANQYMSGLVNTILDFARTEARQVQLRAERVPLRPLLDDVLTLAAPQFDAKRVSCALLDDGGEARDRDLAIVADGDKTRQILLNLLGNSVKFTPAGGRVTVTVAVHAAVQQVAITVRDTGVGIAAEQLSSVFEPFVQVNRELTPEHQQGVGLGLTISRDLARAMQGDVLAESVPGVGSAFTLHLPLSTGGDTSVPDAWLRQHRATP